MFLASHYESGFRAVCDSCPYLLSRVAREAIEVQINLLESSLLGDKLHQKVYIT